MSRDEDRVTQMLTKKLNRRLSRDPELRREIATARLSLMEDDVKKMIQRDKKLMRYLEDVKIGVKSINDEDSEIVLGKKIASYAIHQNRINEYFQLLKKIYRNRVSHICSERSQRAMFKSLDLSMDIDKRSYIKDTDIRYEHEGSNYVFWRASRKARITIGKPNSEVRAYVPINKADGNLYLASKYPRKYPLAIYMPYLINNQPIAKNRVFWRDEETGRVFYSRKTWWNKQDKGFIKDIVNRFNRSKSKPQWVHLDYNKELFK